jgi:hypothetical protein
MAHAKILLVHDRILANVVASNATQQQLGGDAGNDLLLCSLPSVEGL